MTYCLKCKRNTKSKDAKLIKTKNGRVILSSKCAVCEYVAVKNQESNQKPACKMNQIINRSLLAEDKFMPEMHSRQPGFIYSACGPFARNKQRIQKFMQTGDTNCIYKNELDKACFQHDMAYGKYKYLEKRTQSDKVLKDKANAIASNPKYNGYRRGLATMVYKFF